MSLHKLDSVVQAVLRLVIPRLEKSVSANSCRVNTVHGKSKTLGNYSRF